jgi:hypothetical protein
VFDFLFILIHHFLYLADRLGSHHGILIRDLEGLIA